MPKPWPGSRSNKKQRHLSVVFTGSARVMLQGKLSLAEVKDEKARRAIPEVLKTIDNFYGFPGYKPERREKDRETAKKYFDQRFQKLDFQIKALN
ncbi:MAG: hypothetical protein H6Q52_263 [Deltaproteobacteria bacterium]|nr:hypothetical protein [Deltaproteobacteria bacterium]